MVNINNNHANSNTFGADGYGAPCWDPPAQVLPLTSSDMHGKDMHACCNKDTSSRQDGTKNPLSPCLSRPRYKEGVPCMSFAFLGNMSNQT
jgi:hypothetical protein